MANASLLRASLLALAFCTLWAPVAAADPDPAAIQMLGTDRNGSATCGSLTLTWSSPSLALPGQPVDTSIRAVDPAGQTITDLHDMLDMGDAYFAPVWCGDILGDGNQVLRYFTSTGGAHCCNTEHLVLLDGSGRHLLDRPFGDGGLTMPVQLDGTGPLELPAVQILSYFGGLSFVSSPKVPLVFAYNGSSYVEATRQFPSVIAEAVSTTDADLNRVRGQSADAQEEPAMQLYALHVLLGDADKVLPSIKSRLSPSAAAWMDAHAAEARDVVANVYSLPGATSPIAGPAAPQPSVAPISAPAPQPSAPAVVAPDPGAAPDPVPANGPQDSDAPGVLTDNQRSDILAAVDRANLAWSNATQTLDGAALNGNVAGAELNSDLAELARLRSQGQFQRNVNTAFTVVDVSLDAPGHATVHTRETWYSEIYNAATRGLLQRTAPTSYAETYAVEFLNGGWIVTKNDV
jgi:hypothetical protein